MGMTLDGMKVKKYEGKRYDQLNDIEKEYVEEHDLISKPEYFEDKVFEADGNWDFAYFLKDRVDLLLDDGDQLVMVIDDEHFLGIVDGIEHKIDILLDKDDDRYDESKYGDGSALYRWTELRYQLKEFEKEYGFGEYYILVEAGW